MVIFAVSPTYLKIRETLYRDHLAYISSFNIFLLHNQITGHVDKYLIKTFHVQVPMF